jgi:hypothetical protein
MADRPPAKSQGAPGDPGSTGADTPPVERRNPSRDEIDPELVSLRRGPMRVGPLLAASIVVFAVFLMLRLRHDLAFSREPATPRHVPDVAELLDGRAGDNDFVKVRATPDRAFAARVAVSVADDGHRAVPVQGTDGRLWLLLGGNVWAEEVAYEELYTGRLRPVDRMPFGDDLRRWVRTQPPAPRHVTADQVKEALLAGADTLTAPTGDRIEVAPDTPVAVVQRVADRVEIRAALTPTLADAGAWAAALREAGVPVGAATREERDAVIFAADVTAEQAGAALARARLMSARVEPVLARHETTWAGLTAGPDGMRLDGGAAIAWSELDWVAVTVARTLPADARILITSERPTTYWYVLPLYLLLSFFAALFAWALVRAVRRAREAAPVPGADAAAA